jgi:hypothetical protein
MIKHFNLSTFMEPIKCGYDVKLCSFIEPPSIHFVRYLEYITVSEMNADGETRLISLVR